MDRRATVRDLLRGPAVRAPRIIARRRERWERFSNGLFNALCYANDAWPERHQSEMIAAPLVDNAVISSCRIRDRPARPARPTAPRATINMRPQVLRYWKTYRINESAAHSRAAQGGPAPVDADTRTSFAFTPRCVTPKWKNGYRSRGEDDVEEETRARLDLTCCIAASTQMSEMIFYMLITREGGAGAAGAQGRAGERVRPL
ncbi:hypothetical protein EVAR_43209_1 [Eumeta japonica]|uniref:Uncharacterized protein n=1 Tax=Eumeta variegata TaxID=151549 RepID=A0A4C1WVU1_EUMVA|nr:hypothetical protein EVAR_43209_1 [Eumeta japonica]